MKKGSGILRSLLGVTVFETSLFTFDMRDKKSSFSANCLNILHKMSTNQELPSPSRDATLSEISKIEYSSYFLKETLLLQFIVKLLENKP